MNKGTILFVSFMVTFIIATAQVFSAPASTPDKSKTNSQEGSLQEALFQKKLNEKTDNNQTEQLSNVNYSSEDLEKKCTDIETDYNNRLEAFKTRLRAMYENADMGYVGSLAQSNDLFSLYEKMQFISIIVKKDTDTLRDLTLTKQDVIRNKQILEDLKGSSDGINLQSASHEDISSEVAKRQRLLSLTDKQEDDILKVSTGFESEIKGLQDLNTDYNWGAMKWPAPSSGVISSPYGMRLHPITKTYKMHTGIDIAARYASIVAANGGKVIMARYNSGYGSTVAIDHGGGISTLYAHLRSIVVKVGQTVEPGQTIAVSGNSGWSTGPHLHFEVRKFGATLNPAEYVSYSN
jgi:murein DD-endopeptidase MepM/ murein hydrolase activator NlpD